MDQGFTGDIFKGSKMTKHCFGVSSSGISNSSSRFRRSDINLASKTRCFSSKVLLSLAFAHRLQLYSMMLLLFFLVPLRGAVFSGTGSNGLYWGASPTNHNFREPSHGSTMYLPSKNLSGWVFQVLTSHGLSPHVV